MNYETRSTTTEKTYQQNYAHYQQFESEVYTMIKVNDDTNQIIFDGVLNSAYKLSKDNKGNDLENVKNVINVTPRESKKVFDKITAFENSGKNFTPTWYNKKEYIILRSVYDIPFEVDGSKLSFDDFCERGLIKNAKVVCKMLQKDGAVYPVAVKVLEDGEMYDAFADM